MTKRVDDGVADCWTEFWHAGGLTGCAETLFLQNIAAHRGEGVGKGRAYLAIPGAGDCSLTGIGYELLSEQGHDREQAKQAGCRARDGPVRPLTLRLHAQVVTDRHRQLVGRTL